MSFRVTIQQPTLTKYRIPVFRHLAESSEFKVCVLYGRRPEWPNACPEGFEGEECRLRIFKLGSQTFFWHQAQLRAVCGSRGDVALLTWNTRYLSLIPSLFLAKLTGTRTVLWGHGYSKAERRFGKWFRNKVGYLASALLFYDERTLRSFLGDTRTNSRLFVAPNALDQAPIREASAAWSRTPTQLEDFQSENDLTGRDVILYCSRLDPNNRVDLLIEACAKFRRSNEAFLILIIGSGDEQTIRLQKLAKDHQIADRCRFLGAIYDEHKLAPWFLSAKVFCYPENIGLSILHAFGYGLPVVTSDSMTQQNPEVVALQDGENGLFYQHGNIDALADALSRILRDCSLQKTMSLAAKKTVTEKYSLNNMVEGMRQSILGTSSRSDQESGNHVPR